MNTKAKRTSTDLRRARKLGQCRQTVVVHGTVRARCLRENGHQGRCR